MDQGQITVVITGASRGIGAALVDLYANAGARVFAVARSVPDTSRSDVRFISADLATDAGIAAVSEAVVDAGQNVDVLINNAGIQNELDLLGKVDPARLDDEIAVNLTGPAKLTLALLPALRDPGGTIVNVTSLVALHPKPSAPIYSATKAGLASFTRALRHQLKATGITVIEAIPPLVATEMTAGRGTAKLTPEDMAKAIGAGVARRETLVAPGKSKLVLRLNRIAPGLVARILSKE